MYCVTAGRIVSFPTLTSSPRQYKYYTCFVKKHQHNLLIFHSFIPFFNVIVLMFLYLLYKLYNFDSFFQNRLKMIYSIAIWLISTLLPDDTISPISVVLFCFPASRCSRHCGSRSSFHQSVRLRSSNDRRCGLVQEKRDETATN